MSGKALPADHPRRCTALARSSGERCRRAAILGGTVCRVHGGAAPQVKAAAKKRLALEDLRSADFGLALAELEIEVGDRSPVEQLEVALKRTSAMTEALRLMVGALTVPGDERTKHPEVWHRGGIFNPDRFGEESTHAILEEYGRWLDRQGRLSEIAIRVGFDERRVRLVESQAQLMATVLFGTVDAVLAVFRKEHPAGVPTFVEARVIEALPTLLDEQLRLADEGDGGS